MFHRTGEFGGKLFFSVQKAICRKKNSFGQNLKISNFPRTKAFGINLKVSISSHLFKNVTPCHDFALNSADSYQFFFPTATKITCNFSFYRPLAAASTRYNFNFPQNPILRLIYGFPFAPVQSLKAVSDAESYKFYQKHSCTEL